MSPRCVKCCVVRERVSTTSATMMVRRPARIAVALLAVVVGAVPLGALAQPEPAGMPSYAVPASADAKADDQETIHGSVASVDDADTLQVNDDRGFVDNVKLEPGTLINPSGSRLQPGMVVTIAGVNRGAVFAARRIDIATASKSSTSPAAPQAQVIPPGQPAPGTELTGNLKTSLDSKLSLIHISEPTRQAEISYAVFCLKK